jgi:hypothetical protein
MSDLFSSLLIFTINKTILSTCFSTIFDFYKNLVNWALTEIESSVAVMTTLGRECYYYSNKSENGQKILPVLTSLPVK